MEGRGKRAVGQNTFAGQAFLPIYWFSRGLPAVGHNKLHESIQLQDPLIWCWRRRSCLQLKLIPYNMSDILKYTGGSTQSSLARSHSWWMRAVRAARVQSPVPVRPMIRVEKVAFLCNPASGACSQALQLSCIDGYITTEAKAKVYQHLEAWGKA